MGWVSNVMLSFSNDELWEDDEEKPRETCEPLEQINKWIKNGRLVSLVGPTYKDTAGYGMDANLYGGGFKHFDVEEFIKVVSNQNWKNRTRVQLWVKEGQEGMDEDDFTFIKLPRRTKPKAAKTKRRTRRA